MTERHTVVRALPILYVLKEGTTDVLKRPKIFTFKIKILLFVGENILT